MIYEEKEVSSVSEMISLLSSFESNWIFRGQKNSDWDLSPTIERLVGPNWDTEILNRLEKFSIERFKQRAHHYFSQEEAPTSRLSWLSVMQHHGTPTRLLDFSESAFVALFFAFDEVSFGSDENSAIWALDYRWFRKKSIEILKKISPDSEMEFDKAAIGFDQDYIFEQLQRDDYSLSWIGEPAKTNRRLSIQKGTFLVACNFQSPLKNILGQEYYKRPDDIPIKKFKISHKLKSEIFKFLQNTTISCSTMYGGLDGFAKDVGLEIASIYPRFLANQKT